MCRVVRLTSPKLNYFIIGGAWLFYVDIYFFVIPTEGAAGVRFSCNITTWLTVIAYTLCFGTIMAKMCRVWLIFRKPSPNKRMVTGNVHVLLCLLFSRTIPLITVWCMYEFSLAGYDNYMPSCVRLSAIIVAP